LQYKTLKIRNHTKPVGETGEEKGGQEERRGRGKGRGEEPIYQSINQ